MNRSPRDGPGTHPNPHHDLRLLDDVGGQRYDATGDDPQRRKAMMPQGTRAQGSRWIQPPTQVRKIIPRDCPQNLPTGTTHRGHPRGVQR
eukprot:scaffold2858_cov659-Pavlova_lutheri.AAC.18